MAAQFLRQPDLVELPAPNSWRRGPQPLTFVHDLATLSPIGAANGDAVLGVNEKTMRVEYFRAPLPSAAAEVPIKPENAAKAAQTFARANFAALFAPDGTAQIRVAVPINERGNYSVEVRRAEQGVLLLQHALVEVSASDGKIAGYIEDDTPSMVRLEAAKTTREAARQAVEAPLNAQAQKEISEWIQEKQQVVLIKGKPQLVWDMVASLKTKTKAPLSYGRYVVSGETGQILQSQTLRFFEPQLKAFRALGGSDVPTTEEVQLLAEPDFRDRFPVPAPDGQTIAFLSNRPHPDAPEWWRARPSGLFLVNRDGTALQNVVPRAEGAIQWSPQGRSLIIDEVDHLAVYDLMTRTRVRVPSPGADLKLGMAVWTSEDTLLLTGQRSGSAVLELFEWRSSKPQETPQSLSSNWGRSLELPGHPIALARSQDNRSLYLLVRKINDTIGECPYALYSQPINEPLSQPKIVVDCLPFVEHLQVTEESVFAMGSGGVLKIDSKTKTFAIWELPQDSSIPVDLSAGIADKIGFFPDGRGFEHRPRKRVSLHAKANVILYFGSGTKTFNSLTQIVPPINGVNVLSVRSGNFDQENTITTRSSPIHKPEPSLQAQTGAPLLVGRDAVVGDETRRCSSRSDGRGASLLGRRGGVYIVRFLGYGRLDGRRWCELQDLDDPLNFANRLRQSSKFDLCSKFAGTKQSSFYRH